MKDALKKDMEEVNEALRDLFYIYQKSAKRLRELRSLHEILKTVYEFENERVNYLNRLVRVGLITNCGQ